MAREFVLTASKTMLELFKCQQFTDIHFICCDGEIGAHTSILATNCEWFERNYKRTSVVTVLEFSKKSVEDFLEFLYSGNKTVEDPSNFEKLVNIFHCKCEIRNTTLNHDLNQTQVDLPNSNPVLTSTPSGSNASKLKINPFAQKNSTSDSTTNSQISDHIPILSQTFAENIQEESINNSKTIRDPSRDNHNSSDSDIFIIEDPNSIIEVSDILSQTPISDVKREEIFDNGENRRNKRKNNMEVHKDEQTLKGGQSEKNELSSSYIPGRKINMKHSDLGMLSDDTEINSPPRRKALRRKIPATLRTESESSTDDSDFDKTRPKTKTYKRIKESKSNQSIEHAQTSSKTSQCSSGSKTATNSQIVVKNTSNFVATSSLTNTDVETIKKRIKEIVTLSENCNYLKTTVNKYKTLAEMEEKLKTFCLSCDDFFPNISNHIKNHKKEYESKSKCPHCSCKLFSKNFLSYHIDICKIRNNLE